MLLLSGCGLVSTDDDRAEASTEAEEVDTEVEALPPPGEEVLSNGDLRACRAVFDWYDAEGSNPSDAQAGAAFLRIAGGADSEALQAVIEREAEMWSSGRQSWRDGAQDVCYELVYVDGVAATFLADQEPPDAEQPADSEPQEDEDSLELAGSFIELIASEQVSQLEVAPEYTVDGSAAHEYALGQLAMARVVAGLGVRPAAGHVQHREGEILACRSDLCERYHDFFSTDELLESFSIGGHPISSLVAALDRTPVDLPENGRLTPTAGFRFEDRDTLLFGFTLDGGIVPVTIDQDSIRYFPTGEGGSILPSEVFGPDSVAGATSGEYMVLISRAPLGGSIVIGGTASADESSQPWEIEFELAPYRD
jgi:hypothetical protein